MDFIIGKYGSLSSPGFADKIMKRIQRQLSDSYPYHTYAHTYNVLMEALKLGSECDLTKREMELLAIAACFHDAGFLEQSENHEDIGARMVAKSMRAARSYSADEIVMVQQAILDTKRACQTNVCLYTCSTKISPALLDADVANFSQDDFFSHTECIRLEKGRAADKTFYAEVLELLCCHKWFTKSANEKWTAQKEKNVAALREMVAKFG